MKPDICNYAENKILGSNSWYVLHFQESKIENVFIKYNI